jgi:hypothetical protein
LTSELDPLLSIVVPARNESALIARTIERLDAALSELGVSYEIIISDSASSDATARIVSALGHPRVRLVHNELPGKGRAIATGMLHARGSIIGFIDADLEIDPSFIALLFAAMRDGADFAIGAKNLPDPRRSLLRRASTFVYNAFVRALLGTPFSDHQAGLKLFRAERVRELLPRITSHGWFWDTEMLFALHRAGARGVEVGVRTKYQRPSQVSFLRVSTELLLSSLKLRLARRHPRHAGQYFGNPDSRIWWTLLLACCAPLLWLLHAELLLTPTVPASYDLTAHIAPIAELRDRLLPQLRVHGWSAQWFAGFPLYYFYFPLPAVLVVLVGSIVPLAAALKLVSVSGILMLPFATYSVFRAMHLTRAQAAVASAVSTTFLLMQSFWFLGGNIASTLAGEFAMSISLSLSLFYLAAVLRERGDTIRTILLPGVLLAAVALSHLVTTLAIVLVTATLLVHAERRRVVIGSWVAGFLLAAFWTLPFLIRHGEMAAVYARAVRSLSELLPLELLPVLIAAVVGVAAVLRHRAAQPLLALTLAGLVGFAFAGSLVYPGRFLPYWYLGLHMVAGFGIAMNRRRALLLWVALVPLVLLNVFRGTGYLRDWSSATFAGIQRHPSWRVLQPLYTQLDQGSGRIYWEQAPDKLAMLGSRNLAAATPYLTRNQPVLNGLWVESSSLHRELSEIDSLVARVANDTAQIPAQAMAPVLARLRTLGVTRFITVNARTAGVLAREPNVRLLYRSGPLHLFRIPSAPLVQARSGADVEILEWSNERIRFRTNAVHEPHIISMSWFPNWRAEGATALHRMPNAMMRLTPQRNEVTMRFTRTWVETAGAAVSLSTLLVVWALALSRNRHLRKKKEHPG